MIHYIKGDATNPQGEGVKVICHICNDIGGWGKGFVLAVSKRWTKPERLYRQMPKDERKLGNVQIIQVEDNILVANMIGQHDVMSNSKGVPPIRYNAVEECLRKVNEVAIELGASLHMPRIGCGLAGGKWEEIEKIINSVVSVEVYVYDLK